MSSIKIRDLSYTADECIQLCQTYLHLSQYPINDIKHTTINYGREFLLPIMKARLRKRFEHHCLFKVDIFIYVILLANFVIMFDKLSIKF